MKHFITFLALAMLVGCSAFNETPNRRIADDCRNCYHYGNHMPDPLSQTMRGPRSVPRGL